MGTLLSWKGKSNPYWMEVWIDRDNMKLSALREVSLAREIREAGAVEMSSLYMGQSLLFIRRC